LRCSRSASGNGSRSSRCSTEVRRS
jgi:hypothetical protein